MGNGFFFLEMSAIARRHCGRALAKFHWFFRTARMYTARPMSMSPTQAGPPASLRAAQVRRWAPLMLLLPVMLGSAMGSELSVGLVSPVLARLSQIELAPPPTSSAAPTPPPGRADAALRRARHTSIRGGVLYIPKTFASPDGSYDLLLHFHGNTKVVLESAEVAKLNAVVAIVNLGIGSRLYEDAYQIPGSYEKLLAQIQRRVKQRGLEHAHLRRVALSSWSAGYGALGTILRLRKGEEALDAVMVLDGIHGHFRREDPSRIDGLPLTPFVDLAERAKNGELLFTITHSHIDPRAYASTETTASYLLEQVGGKRYPRYPGKPPEVFLQSAVGAVAKSKEKSMRLTSEARLGQFHVRGYAGETPEHHMAHLLQMGATVLPELTQRWAKPAR
jgi:hypothetical protein